MAATRCPRNRSEHSPRLLTPGLRRHLVTAAITAAVIISGVLAAALLTKL